MSFEKVTIVISATDESESLIKTVDFIMSACNRSDIETLLIVIPKNAHEKCTDTIGFLKSKYPDIVRDFVQHHPYIGGALRDSVEEVESSHIMFTSADIPVSLESIPLMIEKAKKNPDTIIKISRWLKKNSFINYGRFKKIFNFLAQKFLRIMFNSDLSDFTSPILISPTEIYKNIKFKEWNFPCLLEAVLIPVKIGCTIEEIPVKCYYRTEGKSKNSIFQTTLYLKTAIRIRFSSKNKLYKE